jgi:hypothetical protein
VAGLAFIETGYIVKDIGSEWSVETDPVGMFAVFSRESAFLTAAGFVENGST